MATISGDRTAVYSGAFAEGAVAVSFFAYTGILISKSHYSLTLSQYGALFIPQVVAAVAATLFAARLGGWFRVGRAYLAGLSCSLAGMALLVATGLVPRLPVSYPLLLAATALVGAGFGLSFPFVRGCAVSLRPLSARRQILLVNAMAGAGMAAAPSYALLTRRTVAWWSLPLLLGLLLIAQMVLSRSLRAPPDGTPWPTGSRRLPAGFRLYPVLALAYGICALVCITASVRLSGVAHVRMTVQVLAEVGFWAALVAGSRVVFALIDGMKERGRAASIGVFLIAFIVLILSFAMTWYGLMYLGIYLLAAVGCAALLPIDTRPGDEAIAVFPLAVTIGLMALFPVGLGLSRLGYRIATHDGATPLEVYLGIAVLGALAGLLLLPVVLRWHTLAYFDEPGVRNEQAPRAGQSGGASALTAPGPRKPPDRSRDDSGRSGRGGATGVPHDPRHDQRRGPGRPR